MSHFVFKAKKPSGEVYTGEKDVADRYELYRMLRESGDEVVEVTEKGAGHSLHVNISFGKRFGRVKVIEKITFARNLGSMLEAGLSLARALSVLERQSRNPTFKQIINAVIDDISQGSSFADALSKHPKTFPQLMTAMVHAGEQSGTLAEALKIVATQMDNAHNLERRVRGALIYPCVILILMIVIAILMFIFVVPTLMKTFTELNVQLPFATRIVLGISTLLQGYGLILALIVAVVGGAIYWWSKQPAGRNFFDGLVLKLPVVGSLVQEVNAARTARTLSSLLGAGVNVIESVTITAVVVQNVHFRRVLELATTAIKKGDLMSKVFESHTKLYPVFMAEMMSVGEETGRIGGMLGGVAHYYEDDVEQKTKDMSTVIEPFLMVFIAAGVGFFAVAMISPMYSLVSAI